jgi:hypothetical protein
VIGLGPPARGHLPLDTQPRRSLARGNICPPILPTAAGAAIPLKEQDSKIQTVSDQLEISKFKHSAKQRCESARLHWNRIRSTGLFDHSDLLSAS